MPAVISAHHRGRGHRRSRDPLTQGSKVALGVTSSGPPGPSLRAFARLVHARPRIVMWYQPWSQPLYYRAQIKAAAALRAIPMITWDPTLDGAGIPLSEIASGAYDGYIKKAAVGARKLRRRIYIRFAHEMNLPSSPFGPGEEGNTATTFVHAWRRVVNIFRREGAGDAEFVWSPNVDCGGSCPFSQFYPGNKWVGWVALDGYNYAAVDGDPWMSFTQIFQRSYRSLVHLTTKPVMIGETASAPDGGDKARWIRGLGSALGSRFRRVRALIWFQRVKETDWRVDSSPSSLAAFRTLVASSLFKEPPIEAAQKPVSRGGKGRSAT